MVFFPRSLENSRDVHVKRYIWLDYIVHFLTRAPVRLIASETPNHGCARSRRVFSIKCKISRGSSINCIPIRRVAGR